MKLQLASKIKALFLKQKVRYTYCDLQKTKACSDWHTDNWFLKMKETLRSKNNQNCLSIRLTVKACQSTSTYFPAFSA